MRNFFNTFFSALALALLVPTSLILISWNALPGDRLYGLKRGLESVALAITIRTPIASAFSIQFTDRRYSEATRLLAKSGSTLGYSYLVEGAQQTKDIVVQKNDAKSGAELVAKIEQYQVQIQEKRQALALNPTAPIVPTRETSSATPIPVQQVPDAPLPSTTPQPAVINPTPPPEVPGETASTPSVPDVIDDLEETDYELEKIKEELKRKLPREASFKSEDGRDKNQKGERSDDN